MCSPMETIHTVLESPKFEQLAIPALPALKSIRPGWEEREIDRLRNRLRTMCLEGTEEFRGELAAETKRLAKKARQEGIKITVETPVRWLSGQSGGTVCRKMYGELLTQLGQLGLSFKTHPISKSNSLKPRPPKEKRLLFSYHTAGEGDQIWRIKESHIPPFFSWDRFGFSGWSTLARSPEIFNVCREIDRTHASQFASSLRERVQRERITKYAQVAQTTMPPDRPYVFFAMQVPGDLVMAHSRLDQRALLQALVQIADERGETLVVKRHPLCKCPETALALSVAQKSPYVRVSNGHIHDLIQHAQSVVVINSGVGMEALLQNKPVFTLGAADYRFATYEVSFVEDLVPAFNGPTPKLTQELMNQFIALYFGAYCIDASNPKSIEGNIAIALKEWLTHAS